MEGLTHAPGKPTVLVATHSSKSARRRGGADVRGVTGLTDAARWVATISVKDGVVGFRQVKSNYSMPMDSPVQLKWARGMLQPMTTADLEANRKRQDGERARRLKEYVDLVVDVLRQHGPMSSKDKIVEAAGIKATLGRDAVNEALASGRIVRSGSGKNTEYRCADDPVN